MSRKHLVLALASALSLATVTACSDAVGPRAKGSDDPTTPIDRKGRKDDSLPHFVLTPAMRENEARRQAEVRREPEVRGQEPQPGDDRGGKKGGNDDPANHR